MSAYSWIRIQKYTTTIVYMDSIHVLHKCNGTKLNSFGTHEENKLYIIQLQIGFCMLFALSDANAGVNNM